MPISIAHYGAVDTKTKDWRERDGLFDDDDSDTLPDECPSGVAEMLGFDPTKEDFSDVEANIEAGGPGSGWTTENGHVGHGNIRVYKNLSRHGFKPIDNIIHGGKEYTKWTHSLRPTDIFLTHDSNSWKKIGSRAGFTLKQGKSIQSLKDELGPVRIKKGPIADPLAGGNINQDRQALDEIARQGNLKQQQIDERARQLIQDKLDKGNKAINLDEIAKQANQNKEAPVHFKSVEEIENSLKSQPIVDSSKLGKGGVADDKRLITMADGTKGIFKPSSGEPDFAAAFNCRWGFQAEHEAGAYIVAKLVDMKDLVPPTIIKDVNGEKGSVQAFLSNATVASAVPLKDQYDGAKDAARAAAFDYVVGNQDRHTENWMISNGKLGLIDHGYCFPELDHVGRGNKFSDRFNGLITHASSSDWPDQLQPKSLAEPYMSNRHEIVKQLTELGMPTKAVTGVYDRIVDLSKATKWKDLQYVR